MSEATQNNTAEVMQWYADFEDHPSFDPDGMCLKICRTARNIASMWPSALSAQIHTPFKYRVNKVANIKKGMIGFFDDPHDSNPFGHVVTFVGRVPDADPNSLHDLIAESNSVVSGKVVKVRADFFPTHWGDSFQFAAPYLNGEEFFDLTQEPTPVKKPVKKKKHPNIKKTLANLDDGIPLMRAAIEANKGNKRLTNALARDLDRMLKTRKHLRAVLDQKGK